MTPTCQNCGNIRQVWKNQITGEMKCHRVGCEIMKTETRTIPDGYFSDGATRTATQLGGPEAWGGKTCVKVETSEPFPLDKKYRIHMVPLTEWETWEDSK